MLSSTHFFVITSLLSLFRHAALASPVPEPAPSPGPDQKPTIWAHSTIDTMKAQRQILYEYALTMYNQQKHFENPVNCLVPLAPNVNYTVGTDCPNANLLSSTGLDDATAAYTALAKNMFPTYYGLPDSSADPRASFSDFAHFFETMNDQIFNIVQYSTYYACNYAMNRYSATQASSTAMLGALYLLQLGPDPNGEYWLNGTAYYSGPPPHENDAFQNAMLRAYKPEDQADDLNDILLFYPAMEPPGYNPCAGYALGSLQPPKNLY